MHVWGKEDFTGGTIVCRIETLKREKVDGWDAKWSYQIGWMAGGKSRISKTSKNRDYFVLISLADGMVGNPKNRDEIMSFLNDNNMAPMSKEAGEKVFEFVRDCHKP